MTRLRMPRPAECVRAVLFGTAAVMLALLSGYVIANGEKRGDPMVYAVGVR